MDNIRLTLQLDDIDAVCIDELWYKVEEPGLIFNRGGLVIRHEVDGQVQQELLRGVWISFPSIGGEIVAPLSGISAFRLKQKQ